MPFTAEADALLREQGQHLAEGEAPHLGRGATDLCNIFCYAVEEIQWEKVICLSEAQISLYRNYPSARKYRLFIYLFIFFALPQRGF